MSLSMEGRMTLRNLTIEGGARAGLIAVDETTMITSRAVPAPPKAAPSRRRCFTGARSIRSRRQIRFRDHIGRARYRADGDLGHLAGTGAAGDRKCAGPGQDGRA